MNKKCFKCKQTKDISLFYKHPETADRHLNKCKLCTKRDVKKRYYDPESKKIITEYERKREKTKHRKAQKLKYGRKRRLNSPGKVKANNAVGNAIRDKRLIRQPCEVCGNLKSQAHHDDYRSYLKVRWLCFKHHREHHGQIVNSKE